MNIFETEIPLKVMAKICGSKEQNNKRVTYSIIDAYNSICFDKKDIILDELEVCEHLSKYHVFQYY
jgi:hypothetical protein